MLNKSNGFEMGKKIYSIITGSGSYIPTKLVRNEDFMETEFYNENGERFAQANAEIIDKFQQITGIDERRYIEDDFMTSDIAYFAAHDAIISSGTDKESLDYIIVAHNFGDVSKYNRQTDMLPALAARVKFKLEISNPNTVAYDLPFGCPGWLQAVIQADYFIKSGDAKRILVIGAEALSRVSDPYDRDSMIYSDGAGAVILEAIESEQPVGILAHKARTDVMDCVWFLKMDKSNNPQVNKNEIYLKMNGRKLYEYAITTVPPLVKETIDKAGIPIGDIKKVLIHQANAKMDEVMLSRLFKSYGLNAAPKDVMPMTISKLGNNSVATLPILYDMLMKGKLPEHQLNKGDDFVFASVGAGMHVNSVVYKMQ